MKKIVILLIFFIIFINPILLKSQKISNKNNSDHFFFLFEFGHGFSHGVKKNFKYQPSVTISLNYDKLIKNLFINIGGSYDRYINEDSIIYIMNYQIGCNIFYKIKIFTYNQSIGYIISGLGYYYNFLKYKYNFTEDDNVERKLLTKELFNVNGRSNSPCIKLGILYDIKPGLIRPPLLLILDFTYSFIKYKNLKSSDKKLYKLNDYYFLSQQKPIGAEEGIIDLSGFSVKFGIGFWIF